MSPRVAVATSEHPIAAHAVAECAGSLIEVSPGGFADILCFVGSPFGGALRDIAGALARLLGASGVAAVESPSVLMGGRMARGTPAVAVVAFAPGVASLGYIHRREPDEPATSPSPPGAGPPLRGHLRILFADPFGTGCAPPSPVGTLPRDATLVGCHLGGGSDAAAIRLLHDGVERRNGALHVDLAGASTSVRLVHGTEAMSGASGEPVTVTSVIDGQVVALDDLPAAELLESRVRSMDPGHLDGVEQVGLVVSGDDRLVAARRSALGLTTSVPLAPGTSVRPAVSSPRALTERLDAVLGGCSAGTVLLCPTADLCSGVPLADLRRTSPGGSVHVVGPVARSVLWGDPARFEAVGRAVLVIGIDLAGAPSAPA